MSQGSASDALREADEGTFAAADLNSDGRITRAEHIHFADLVVLSIDGAGDGTVTLEEFLGWDPGYVYAAGKINKVEAVEEAKEDIFKELDLNEDGTVDHGEMSAASLYFFYRADVDQSRALDQKEFTEEFRILKTMRAAFE